MAFPDFEEFTACLNAERARFLIVGAYAVGFHGHPRATKDLDVLLDRAPTNGLRVLRALKAFLGTTKGVTSAKLANPRTLIVLGVAPIRIDLLTSIAGVDSFSKAFARSSDGKLGTTPVHYLGLVDLLDTKRASARLQDLADVEALERIHARLRTKTTRKPRE